MTDEPPGGNSGKPAAYSKMLNPILLTIGEAAKACHMGESAIKKAIRSGALRSGKFGKSRRILVKDLEEWARKIVVNSMGFYESPQESLKIKLLERRYATDDDR